jgi:hypothetical protein
MPPAKLHKAQQQAVMNDRRDNADAGEGDDLLDEAGRRHGERCNRLPRQAETVFARSDSDEAIQILIRRKRKKHQKSCSEPASPDWIASLRSQ